MLSVRAAGRANAFLRASRHHASLVFRARRLPCIATALIAAPRHGPTGALHGALASLERPVRQVLHQLCAAVLLTALLNKLSAARCARRPLTGSDPTRRWPAGCRRRACSTAQRCGSMGPPTTSRRQGPCSRDSRTSWGLSAVGRQQHSPRQHPPPHRAGQEACRLYRPVLQLRRSEQMGLLRLATTRDMRRMDQRFLSRRCSLTRARPSSSSLRRNFTFEERTRYSYKPFPVSCITS